MLKFYLMPLISSLIVSTSPKELDFATFNAIDAYSGARIIGNKIVQIPIIKLTNA